jgi:HEAT repeat protein
VAFWVDPSDFGLCKEWQIPEAADEAVRPLVVCKNVCFSLGAVDAGEDLVGVLGPGEGLGVVVPVVYEGADGGGEFLDGGEGAAADGLAGDDREEAFHEVDPRASGRREVQGDPLVLRPGEPCADLSVLMGGVVVTHDVQVLAGAGGGDLVEEFEEFLVAVAGVAGIGYLAGGGVERGEQAGHSVPDVVVSLPFGDARAHREDRLGPFQSLALGLLVSADDHGVLRRVQVEADDVADLRVQLRIGGELEALRAVRLQAELAPQPGDAVMADGDLAGPAQPVCQPPGRPVRHPLGLQGLRRRGHRGGQDLTHRLVGQHRLRAARPGRVLQPGQPVLRILAAPFDHGRLGAPGPLRDLRPGQPFRGQQHNPGPLGHPGRSPPVPGTPFQLRPVSIGHPQDPHAIRHKPLSPFPRKHKGKHAFHFASLAEGWADQMLGAQVMSVIRSLEPLFTEAGGDAAAILRRLSVESGVLVPVVTPGSGRNPLYQFLHRSIAEYLVAWHLATLPRAEWLETVRDHLFFDPDWQPALSMLGAAFVLQQRPGEAAFLLSFLLDQDDDPFDRAIFTAARVTAELPAHDFLPQDLTDRLAKRLTWLIDEDPGSQAAEELLARYLTRLPWPITERLLGSLQTSVSPCYPRILANSRDPRVTSQLVALLDDDARAETIYSALHAQQCDAFIEAMLSRFDEPQQQAAAVKVLRTYQDDWHVAETMALALDGPFRTAALDVLRTSHDARLTDLWRGLADDDDSDVRSMAVGWLAEHAQTDVTDVMRARAQDSDVFVQAKALTALLESDATGLDVVLEFARRPNRYARTRAAEALARHPESAQAGAALIELAGDACVPVRYWAARSLGIHPTDGAAAALLNLLDDEECAPPALEALKSHNRPHVRARVIAWVGQDPGPDRFIAAVDTLAAMSSPETTKLLADRATHQAEKVRQAAVRALAGHDSQAAVSALLARLTDTSSSVRRAAATALVPLSDRPEIVTTLLAHLTDEDAEVRAEVIRALPLSDRHPDVVSRLLPLLADHGGFWRSAVAGKLDGSSSVMALRWIGEASDLHRAPGLAEVSEAIEHLADRAFRALTGGERERVLRRLAVLSLRREPMASGEPSTTGSGPETTTMPGPDSPAETRPGQNSWSTPGIGKDVSPDVWSDELLETEIIILLQGANLYGNRVYSYVKILGRRLKGMFVKMRLGENFKPADFGEVLAAGLGEPPPDIRDMMKEKFNMTEVELAPRPVTTFMPRFVLDEDGTPETADSTCGPVADDGSGGREGKTVILLQGYGFQGERVYVYLRLPRGRVDDVRAKIPAAEQFRPAEFGTVLRAGRGEPPPEIHQMLTDVYGRIDNWAEALESRHGFDERLTEPARRVLALAGESADPHCQDHVGTERILLSMIREGEGVAVRVLESLGINLEAVSRRAEEITGWRPAPTSAAAAGVTDRHLPQDQASDVPALTPEAAAAYLMTRTGDQDTMAARELAVELAGLPRALEQAVVYASATRTPLAQYLPLLRGSRAALPANAEDDTGSVPTPIAAALSLTLTLVADDLGGRSSSRRSGAGPTAVLPGARADPARPAAIWQTGHRRYGSRRGGGDRSATKQSGRDSRCDHRSKALLPGRSGRGRHGAGASYGPGRHSCFAASRRGGMGAVRRRPGRASGAGRGVAAHHVADVRAAGVPCEGDPRANQQRHVARGGLPRSQRGLSRSSRSAAVDHRRAYKGYCLRARSPGHSDRAPRTRSVDGGGRRRRRRPRSACRPPARPGTAPGTRRLRHDNYPPRDRSVHRAGWKRSRGPRPVREAAACRGGPVGP